MTEVQTTIEITPDVLVAKVLEMHAQCYRLVQIGATPLKDIIEVNYSFDRDSRFINYRVKIPSTEARLPSISSIYWCAFIYENELHDLFKIQVDGNAVDFKGEFYKMAVPFPFAPTPTATPATASTPPVAASTETNPAAPAPTPTPAPSATAPVTPQPSGGSESKSLTE